MRLTNTYTLVYLYTILDSFGLCVWTCLCFCFSFFLIRIVNEAWAHAFILKRQNKQKYWVSGLGLFEFCLRNIFILKGYGYGSESTTILLTEAMECVCWPVIRFADDNRRKWDENKCQNWLDAVSGNIRCPSDSFSCVNLMSGSIDEEKKYWFVHDDLSRDCNRPIT